MSNILGRFRKRNIQTNFYHFALVVFVVAISVCLISGLFINYFTLKSSVDRFFTQSKLPNLWIGTNQITKDDEDFFASKFDYGKRYKFETNYNVGSKEFEGEFFVSDGKITIPYIMEGERERGCYVDAKFAELNNFGLNYSVVSFNYELGGEKKELEFKVVGFISFAEYLSADGESMIFIDEDVFLDEMKSEFAGIYDADLSIIDYNEILISSEVSERDIQDIQSYYDLSDSKIISVTKRADIESVIAINNELEIAKKMLWIFPIIFVLISILVICSAISQFVLKERYNIGMLKSLGISNNRILSNYCGYGVVICFIGACFGLMIAPLIIPNMTFAVYDKLYNLPRDLVKLNCPVWFVVLIILYAVIVGCFTSLFVTINLVKKTPKECMSRFLKTNLKSRKKKRKLPVIFGAPINNMKINLPRTIMSIVGVAGGSLLILLGFGAEEILKNNSATKEFLMMEIFSRIFKGFSIALVVLTIVILLVQIFKERHKEMAILRIHGERYIKIWLSVLFEMIFIGVIGFAISVLLSGPVMLLNLRIFGISEYFSIEILGYLKTFLMIFLTIIFVSGFGLMKIYRLRLDEAIKISE